MVAPAIVFTVESRVKCKRKHMTKQRASVSFWTTWLDVKINVNVCRIFTSCNKNRKLNLGKGVPVRVLVWYYRILWVLKIITSIPASISIHNVSVIYLAPLKSITLFVTKRCIKARHIRTNLASFVSQPWTG